MLGQWVGKTDGTNKGIAVLNLDFKKNENFIGRLNFTDTNSEFPSLSCATILMKKSNSILGKLFDFNYFDNSQRILLTKYDYQKIYPNIDLPTNGEIKGSLDNDFFSGNWSTDIDTKGKFDLNFYNQEIKIDPDFKFNNWDDYIGWINDNWQDIDQFIFRGQKKSWPLRTSFHRHNRWDLVNYSRIDIEHLLRHINSLSSYKYKPNDKEDYGALLCLAQHHGFPTPLLDWTESPYVAAYFCYENIEKFEKNDNEFVRIYAFNAKSWEVETYQTDSIGDPHPTITIRQLAAFDNNRAIPQQSISTFSNIDNMELLIDDYEKENSKKLLYRFDLPYKLRDEILKDLRFMNITSASLFPGFDGVCKSLRHKNFDW